MKPYVFCNSTNACTKWVSGRCLQRIKCLRKSCDESILTESHLTPLGESGNEFLHGYQVPVTCAEGFAFAGDGYSPKRVRRSTGMINRVFLLFTLFASPWVQVEFIEHLNINK